MQTLVHFTPISLAAAIVSPVISALNNGCWNPVLLKRCRSERCRASSIAVDPTTAVVYSHACRHCCFTLSVLASPLFLSCSCRCSFSFAHTCGIRSRDVVWLALCTSPSALLFDCAACSNDRSQLQFFASHKTPSFRSKTNVIS